jgi:hypothetical protein
MKISPITTIWVLFFGTAVNIIYSTLMFIIIKQR